MQFSALFLCPLSHPAAPVAGRLAEACASESKHHHHHGHHSSF
ncbi:hypothetical protein [Hymenobacter sp. 102]